MNARCGILASLLLACFPQGMHAAPPDWTGYYTLSTNRELAGTGLHQTTSRELDDLIVAHLQPWAKARLDATDGVADDTGAICQPTGPFRNPNNAGRFLWLPGPDRVVLVFSQINTAGVRRIYLNAQHPRNLLPTWNGHSIGHWETDTLVIDTVGFTDKTWLMNGMQPHTEETHMMERMRLVANERVIANTVVMEDRHALVNAYTFTRYYTKQNREFPENVCNEDVEIWKQFKDDAFKRRYEHSKEVK